MAESRDPGGKARFKHPEDVAGEASFSPCGRYVSLARAQPMRCVNFSPN